MTITIIAAWFHWYDPWKSKSYKSLNHIGISKSILDMWSHFYTQVFGVNFIDRYDKLLIMPLLKKMTQAALPWRVIVRCVTHHSILLRYSDIYLQRVCVSWNSIIPCHSQISLNCDFVLFHHRMKYDSYVVSNVKLFTLTRSRLAHTITFCQMPI